MHISDDFIANNWLPRRPAVFRQLIDKAALGRAGIDTVLGSCMDPVKAVLYMGSEAPASGGLSELPRVHEAPALYRRLCAAAIRRVLYFIGLGKVAPGFEALTQLLQFGYEWRFFEQIVSLSTPGTVIETHIDLIDSLIIQLEGTRHWKMWDIDTDVERRIAVNNCDRTDRMSPPGDAIVDIELSAGDVLYIPALYPHQAYLAGTEQSSLSASIGWAALTPIRILRAAMVNERRSELEELFERTPEPYLALISDPEPGKDHLLHIADNVIAMLDPVQRLGIDRMDLLNRLRDVKFGALAGATGQGSLPLWKQAVAFAAD